MSTAQNNACCGVNNIQIESIVRFDDRGQFVLPKEIREKADIKAGDKLAVISCEDDNGEVCCLTVMKSDKLQGMVKEFLGPMFQEMTKEESK